jgi:hypothetical protein
VSGLEPIAPRDLHDFLIGQGCVFDHQVGAHVSGHAPNGATIRIPDPGSAHPVTTLLLKEIARGYGKNLHDMRVWLGYGTNGKSKLTSKRAGRAVKRTVSQATIEDVYTLATRAEATAKNIFRSGVCRKATHERRRELQAIVSRLEHWFRVETEKAD